MLVNTADGMVYTFDETKVDLEIAGVSDVEYAVPDQTMSAVIVAIKL